ncbi:MAG TPA: O-antigen ligase family protein [Chiayiivirga sp.]|nr:O-antigen ligase family protein [Chiayiivirga sp.]
MATDRVSRPLAWWLLLATLALLPFGVAPELPVLIGAVIGVAEIARGRIDWTIPAVRIALVIGLGYWLAEFISAWDSVVPAKSWSEAALDLRLIAFLVWVAASRWNRREVHSLTLGIGLITALWCLDAAIQAVAGVSLGGPLQGDRLSGIFGDDNLKLGGVLAVLSPIALCGAQRLAGTRALIAAWGVLLALVLLAGARAAWLGFLLGTALVCWRLYGGRRASQALAALALASLAMAAIAYSASARFAERIDRSVQAFSADREGLDHALSGRLDIWDAAWRMSADHPVNGVGVRGFREAYPAYANADDPFVVEGIGAFHAHQIVLEVLSETGLIGLVIWLGMVVVVVRHYRRLPGRARVAATGTGIAMLVAVFPINTHYAVYSAFWGLFLFWLVAVWLAALAVDQS